ncbi:MAG TPA: carbon-nitrogen hydrolase family protein [Tepidisphaeraceae bacterium]|jgi:predicted amidohydrolase|nr:carbon-nitrogen hydrolase family protein [Tepidisphaeraceae bacterium]
MSHAITLAVGQFSSGIGGLDDNLSAALRLSAGAVKQGARFILFPEDCLSGYPGAKDSAHAVAIDANSAIAKKVCESAVRLGITIAAGFIERRGDRFHASHLIAFDDGTKRVIRKRSLDERDRRIGLSAAEESNDDFEIAGARTAMAICMDGTDDFFAAAKKRKVHIILHPSGGACAKSVHQSDAEASRIEAREKINCRKCLESAQNRARALEAVYCVANSVGFDGERGYPGNSWVVSSSGEVLAYLPGTAIIEEMHEGIGVAKVML